MIMLASEYVPMSILIIDSKQPYLATLFLGKYTNKIKSHNFFNLLHVLQKLPLTFVSLFCGPCCVGIEYQER